MAKTVIVVAGIGPGSESEMTPEVAEAIGRADVVVGYSRYLSQTDGVRRAEAETVGTGMRQERQRAVEAFRQWARGKKVVVVSSGDSGIYGMASLMFETREALVEGRLTIEGSQSDWREAEIEVLPGISAFQKSAALLGAPISHDTCLLSLSDLLTPWPVIERRIRAAADGDFVTAVYNPRSGGRRWQLGRLRDIFLERGRSAATPVGVVRQAGRQGESVVVTTLGDMDPEGADMVTTVIIGNSQSYVKEGKIITPRGYGLGEGEEKEKRESTICSAGRDIMTRSFLTIEREMRHPDMEAGKKWAMLHVIHTTADFEMEDLLYSDEGAVEELYARVTDGRLRTIVTDVTMVRSGIRKGALERLGIKAECYIGDPRAKAAAEKEGITRAQAAMRIAAEEHPDALFAFGNAPTALMELCSLARQGRVSPAGLIAAPVGFVNVLEAKAMAKTLNGFPKIIVEGRKGGSGIAATLCNAVLTFDDARALKPGRDL